MVVIKAPSWRRHFTLFHLHLRRPFRPQPARGNPLSGARLYAMRAERPPQLRPIIDSRVNELGSGAVASFGYHPGVVARTLATDELDGAAENRLGHSESSAGVSLNIPL